MIPKIIHYVWVGNNEKPEIVLKCIESWKKYCPDYEIIEWNNNSLREIDNKYVSQAFECKKWAFVSDYLRLYALKNFGGFYFDTDLEITNRLDNFLDKDFVTGFEEFNGKVAPITALMGAKKDNKIISDLLSEYKDIDFIKNGKMDTTTNVTRITKYFEQEYNYTSKNKADETFLLRENSIIYPVYYFCLKKEGKINYSIHHYCGSWVDGYSRKNILSIGKNKLVRFRRRKNINNEEFPLLKNEEITNKIKILNYVICLVKEQL